jgi:hypothetical protein
MLVIWPEGQPSFHVHVAPLISLRASMILVGRMASSPWTRSPCAAIGQAVEELKEASERVGRKDWKLMFYGAFVSLGLAQALSSGVVDVVFRLAVEGLSHIFGAGGTPMITT